MTEADATSPARGTRGEAGPPSSTGRDLSLPLVDDRDSTLWAGIEAAHRDQSVWPALTTALSETGRRLLWQGLHETVESTPGDPERALMVVEAFHRTMRIRRGPDYRHDVLSRLEGAQRNEGPERKPEQEAER